MGRVSRYKKIRSCDPYSRENRGGNNLDVVGIWGMGNDGRKAKKISRTAEKLRVQKMKRRQNKLLRKSGGRNNKKNEGIGFDNQKKKDGDGFDLPPEEADDFDLSDIVGSVKKVSAPKMEEYHRHHSDNNEDHETRKAAPLSVAWNDPVQSQQPPSTAVGAAAVSSRAETTTTGPSPPADEDEHVANRVLKLESQVRQGVEKEAAVAAAAASSGRLPGESKRAYDRRVKAETARLIQRERKLARNPEKIKKKKEFLNNRKKNKKKRKRQNFGGGGDDGGGGRNDSDMHDDDGEDEFITGEWAVSMRSSSAGSASPSDEVKFGEQAERPPVFRQLPRGAKKNETTAKKSKKRKKDKDGDGSRMSDKDVEAEQRAMEMMRRKVQAQYAMIRKQRKGEFHL